MGAFILDWAFFLIGLGLLGFSKKIANRKGKIAVIAGGIVCIVVSTIIMFHSWGWL